MPQSAILKHTPTLGRESVQIMDALNRVLACDVSAAEDMPLADVSALDGYAVCHKSLATACGPPPTGLRVIAEASAGFPCNLQVMPGTAVRIMTGALIPKGTDTVIKRELTFEKEGCIFCENPPVPGQGIRFQGESFKKGDVVLRAGTFLSPLQIGGLAGLRRPWVYVHRRPVVAVLATGSELADLHDPISRSKTICSNLYALSAQVSDSGAAPLRLGLVRDRLEPLLMALEEADHADVVLTSGGTSKGKYDLTRKAFDAHGVKIRFSNQTRKKGKPSLFGTRGRQLFFALPGNPYAAMLSFDQLVRPALLKMMGHRDITHSPARRKEELSRVDTAGREEKSSSLWAPSVHLGKSAPKKPVSLTGPAACNTKG